ncbi:MAG: TRAP transporter substrate-binding protein DctP [Candidatus Rokubacteria bacterium]|nr:TRAP transporter substrate-binding protein DctP [Candidatus Rokubacteria bacterium]
MKRTLMVVSLTVLLLALVAGGAALAPPPAGAQAKIVWNFPHVSAPTYFHTVNYTAFANRVKEKSQGRMEIRFHPASSLYPGPELISAALDGRAEIAPVLASYLTDVLLEMGPLELPFMTSGMEEHKKAAFQLRPFYTEMLAKKGLKMLAMSTWPSQQIFSTVPIRTVADWKGKKIRVYGADSANITRMLGAAPVNIAFGEVYSALEKKTVDGAMTSATNAEPMKFFEVAKYLDYWYLAGAAQEWVVVNQKVWDALPKDLQQIVLDAVKETNLEEKEWADAIAFDERVKKRLPELGMTVVDVPKDEIAKARTVAKEAWDTWLKRTGADGKRGLDLALKALGR